VIWLNAGIVLLLILIGALFVGTEIALVTLREGQVRGLAEGSRRGQRVARLVHDPNRFLAAVQIGVTTTALLASAFGEATLGEHATSALERAGLGHRLAGVLGFLGVVLVIAYVTIVLGELVPKRLGLQRPVGTATLLGPTLDRIAYLARPVIWLLSRSTDLLVRLLGADPHRSREAITEEELRGLVAAHESLSTDERKLIDEVFASGERQVREVMVPRTEVDFLDAGLPIAKAAAVAAGSSHSRFPVVRGSPDDVVGFVHVRDLFVPPQVTRRSPRVGDLVRDVVLLPATKRVLPALSEMRGQGQHIAVVVDEYGGTAGIVTLEDLIEELIGDIRDEYDPAGGEEDPRRLGGEVEVGGLLNLGDFLEQTGVELPEGPYETVAGYIMATLGRVVEVGDAVETEEARLKVTAVDGRRVARVQVSPLHPAVPDVESSADGSGPPQASGSVVVAGPGVSSEAG
jgi:putative hemolysin